MRNVGRSPLSLAKARNRKKEKTKSSVAILSAGVFAGKWNGFAVKPKGRLQFSVKSRQEDYFEKQRFGDSSPSTPYSPQSAEGSSPRFYVGHSIYKGKAVLTIEPLAPEFVALESGAFKLTKEGFLLLQFAPVAGVRPFDWSRKQVFSLSITEIGNLVSLGPRESCEFFHDPIKGKGSDEGKVRKVLKVEPLPDGSGRFFNLIQWMHLRGTEPVFSSYVHTTLYLNKQKPKRDLGLFSP